jgi:type I restriction enzyme S subunit
MVDVRLGDLVDDGSLVLGDGYRTRADQLGPVGLPILRVAEVRDGRLEHSAQDRVREDFRARIGPKASQPGDVVLTTKGTVGRVAMIRESDPEYVYSPQVCFFRSAGEVVHSRWLYYWLLSSEFKLQARGVQGQTDMAAYINLQDLRAMRISIPPIEEQRGIAATLGALDYKIESDRRAIELLDQLGRALWLKACSAGVRPTGVNALISAGSLVVGDGYRATNTELGLGGLPFARAADLRDGFDLFDADRLDDAGVARAGDKISRPGDAVFTSKGTVGRFAYVSEDVPRMVYSPQLCYWRSLDHETLPPSVLYQWLRGSEAWEQFSAVKGQTDMADYVSLGDQRRMRMSLPAAEFVRGVGEQLDALLKKSGDLRGEIATLGNLRDALLIELLAGRIRVPEAEAEADQAVPGRAG